MPVAPTYPGVYIEEVPSSVRTIIGVPTSTTGFVGTTPIGPVNDATEITSWGDFEREFGGLDPAHELGYAVFQYYQNGGSAAVIVRVAADDAKAATISVGANGPALTARSEGTWGNGIQARVDHKVFPTPTAGIWNLYLRDSRTGVTESFLNITKGATSANPLSRALSGSQLVSAAAIEDEKEADDKEGAATGDPWADKTLLYEATGGDNGAPAAAATFVGGQDGESEKKGLYALLATDIFNLLVVAMPSGFGAQDRDTVLASALKLCVDRRAVLLVDAPWTSLKDAADNLPSYPLLGDNAINAAIYFPRLCLPDRAGGPARWFGAAASIAGVCARTDVQRGVWKAPAGLDASITDAQGLEVELTDLENGRLNPLGVNCLRRFPLAGTVAWGARTLRGADALASQWKYLPVRRTALFIEESLYRGTKWAVFEPNDEPLWASLRLNIGVFMNTLFRQGAFAGATPRDAYFVKCDAENNPQADIDRGIVNVLVGFRPLKPAEFVIIHIQQLAGQLTT